MQRVKQWIRRQNYYLWVAGAGVIGLIDALVPGPTVTRLIGGLVVLAAAWFWLGDPK